MHAIPAWQRTIPDIHLTLHPLVNKAFPLHAQCTSLNHINSYSDITHTLTGRSVRLHKHGRVR